MAQPNYDINYEDERFQSVENDKNQALTELEQTYGGMIDESDRYYQSQIDASKQWAEKQSQLQQEKTDFAIEQINQQKEQAQKDYTKEQSGSYVDWQKQSNAYGVNAEQRAAAGLTDSGYSESSQVSMYNTYQNRVAIARQSFQQAVLNYNNAIKDAQLQNNSALAEIALNALQKQLELSLAGFQYKNSLLIEQANKKVELENTYYNRYLDVLNQINQENALKESIRQFELNYQQQQKEYEEGVRQFNEEIARLKANDAQDNAYRIQQLELQKQQLIEEQRQFETEQALKQAQLAEEKRQYDDTMAYKKQTDGQNGTDTEQKSSVIEKPSEEKSAQSGVTIDKTSVAKLGYGDLTEAQLASLVANGNIGYKQVGNKLVFYKIGDGKGNRVTDERMSTKK